MLSPKSLRPSRKSVADIVGNILATNPAMVAKTCRPKDMLVVALHQHHPRSGTRHLSPRRLHSYKVELSLPRDSSRWTGCARSRQISSTLVISSTTPRGSMPADRAKILTVRRKRQHLESIRRVTNRILDSRRHVLITAGQRALSIKRRLPRHWVESVLVRMRCSAAATSVWT